MKKVLSILAAMAMVIPLVACGNQSVESSNQEMSEPLDLTGEWIQTNQNAEDQYQVAVITDHTIEVYWVSDGGDTKALYWAGTYVAPETAEDSYSLDSENDSEKTGSSLLASGDETKRFSYESGELSYDVSALGVTTTVRMEKQ